MKFDPGYAWLGTVVTLDVTAWFVWLAAFALARHALDPCALARARPVR